MTSLAFGNCRGANKRKAAHYLKEFVKEWNVFFVGVVETKISSVERFEVNKLMGEEWDYFMFPSEGASSGIIVLWKYNMVKFSLLFASKQCVIGEVRIQNRGKWIVSTVYGNKNHVLRRRLWEEMERNFDKKIPVIVGGDFNCILSQEDKRGGKKFSFSQGPQDMSAIMNRNDFHNVGMVGPKFTWCNNKNGSARILEKLDRCLLNAKALQEIQNTMVRYLPRIASDHCPLILKIYHDKVQHNGYLKFEDVWTSFPTSKAIVLKVWNKQVPGNAFEVIKVKCKKTLRALHYWSINKLKNFQQLKDVLKREIEDLKIEESERNGLSQEKLLLLRSKIHEYNVNLACLSTGWRQRSKIEWIKDNDMNTEFFQTFANSRRIGNSIFQLKNEEGVLTEK
ncbi:hypothetical protein KFK09_003860 [Dendrobium nobile]|uniref:Endonuclease/exonuclease/phosphatase domain-containing protein n=1 Tax=Dendrobium nobile TaxID=94219 RepID=A0A8T3BYZ9_DENNO|nr:hypothetical protein KFK09_003860 [Dendrobium nobile]